MDAETKRKVEEYRSESLEAQIWKAKSDASYYCTFLNTLLDNGFSKEQAYEMTFKKMEFDRDTELINSQNESNEYIAKINAGKVFNDSSEEECQCSDCKRERGETDESEL